MITDDGAAESNSFTIELETLEFSTTKLDSMLFEIPPGYTQVKNIADLQDQFDAAALAETYSKADRQESGSGVNSSATKPAGGLRIGVLQPGGVDASQASGLQAYLVSELTEGKVQALPVASAEEAKRLGCDLTLTTQFTQVKSASKVGGILKAIKNTGPTAASAYNIEARFSLANATDGTTRSEKAISGKYEGDATGAARKALEEGSRMLLRELN